MPPPKPRIYYVGYGIYLGPSDGAKNPDELKRRNISHVLKLGKKNEQDENEKVQGVAYHTFEISDAPNAPYDTFLKDKGKNKNKDADEGKDEGKRNCCVRFIESFRAKQENRLLVHCEGASIRSPFAIRCIFIRFFGFTPFQARVRLRSIYPYFQVYQSMLEAELGLCSRADKENDFGLREHPLATSTAPDDGRHLQFINRSLFFIMDIDEKYKRIQDDFDGTDKDFDEDCLTELQEKLRMFRRLAPNNRLFAGDKNNKDHILKLVNFRGCERDNVYLDGDIKCILYSSPDGEEQFFPKRDQQMAPPEVNSPRKGKETGR